MQNGRALDIARGGACTFQLPHDPSIASMARSLLTNLMRQLTLASDLIDNGAVAVSELATNAHCHASPRAAGIAPELWIWARTCPGPQMIVSIFDGEPGLLPEPSNDTLLAEGGRGLTIVEAIADDWGTHLSRSRHRSTVTIGKSVWFALPLPEPWPGTDQSINPALAAHRLMLGLGARGIAATQRSDTKGVSLVQIGDLNIWVEPKHFSWSGINGALVRRPLIDLQETTEHIVHQFEKRTRP